jgi:hypothetical protein
LIIGDRLFTFGNFEVIEKGDEKETKIGVIKGPASTEAKDVDEEVIIQAGLDWDYFLSHGFLTYEHPLGVANTVGAPSKTDAITKGEIDGYEATILKGDIMLNDPAGEALYSKAMTLQKSNIDRKFGYSIEGKVIKRDGNIVEKARVISVAITAAPKNPLTWWEPADLLRSMMAQPGAVDLFRAMVGYPSQGQPNHPENGDLAPVVNQSIQGVVDATGLKRTQIVKDLSDDELLVALFLQSSAKNGNQMTWGQGVAAVEAMKQKVKL